MRGAKIPTSKRITMVATGKTGRDLTCPQRLRLLDKVTTCLVFLNLF